ncbi:MAG: hypothetical protein DRI61_16340 [Chloroflexi bacterium]|nr:MAG: hypothetical protein DRI61_16340 [Chloroflexota bacterium]
MITTGLEGVFVGRQAVVISNTSTNRERILAIDQGFIFYLLPGYNHKKHNIPSLKLQALGAFDKSWQLRYNQKHKIDQKKGG